MKLINRDKLHKVALDPIELHGLARRKYLEDIFWRCENISLVAPWRSII